MTPVSSLIENSSMSSLLGWLTDRRAAFYIDAQSRDNVPAAAIQTPQTCLVRIQENHGAICNAEQKKWSRGRLFRSPRLSARRR